MTWLKRATVLPITLFGLACEWCHRAQRLGHDSGIMAVLSRCDNNFIPVVSLQWKHADHSALFQ